MMPAWISIEAHLEQVINGHTYMVAPSNDTPFCAA